MTAMASLSTTLSHPPPHHIEGGVPPHLDAAQSPAQCSGEDGGCSGGGGGGGGGGGSYVSGGGGVYVSGVSSSHGVCSGASCSKRGTAAPPSPAAAAASVAAAAPVAAAAAPASAPPSSPTCRVGYVLSEKKAKSFLKQELLDACRRKKIHLVPIRSPETLGEKSGRDADVAFDAIIHKSSSYAWRDQLKKYCERYPNCVIVDDPAAVARLRNRVTMLQAVDEGLTSSLAATCPNVSVRRPRQMCATDPSMLTCEALEAAGLRFPVIAKPVSADGSMESHAMHLVLNATGLASLRPPVVLQQFVNHGGVLFKAYVVGPGHATVVARPSLPDCQPADFHDSRGVREFSLVSNSPALRNARAMAGPAEASGEGAGGDCWTRNGAQAADLPPQEFVASLAGQLARNLDLHLFNFDLIRETSPLPPLPSSTAATAAAASGAGGAVGKPGVGAGTAEAAGAIRESSAVSPDALSDQGSHTHYHQQQPGVQERYYVVDINYFPGFAKMPGYAEVVSRFLRGVVDDHRQQTDEPCVAQVAQG